MKEKDNKVHSWCRKGSFVPQVVSSMSQELSSQWLVLLLAMMLVLLLLLLLPWYCMAWVPRQDHDNTVAHAAHANNKITTLMPQGV